MTHEELLRYFADKKTAFQLTFGSPTGKAVLADLAPYCRAKESCVVIGDRDRTYVLEGRRDVYLRIQQFLELPPEDLIVLNTRPAEGATSHE